MIEEELKECKKQKRKYERLLNKRRDCSKNNNKCSDCTKEKQVMCGGLALEYKNEIHCMELLIDMYEWFLKNEKAKQD